MRVLLLLGLLPGCLWSKHVHDYNVDLDGPAALEVRVITADGVQTVLPAGSPEDRGTIVVDNVPLTVIRDAQGIRVEAEKALTELQLVGFLEWLSVQPTRNGKTTSPNTVRQFGPRGPNSAAGVNAMSTSSQSGRRKTR